MKTIDELEKAVNDYCTRHGMIPQYTKCRPDEKYYFVRSMDYSQMEARILEQKNGKTRVIFKVDGNVTSLYK